MTYSRMCQHLLNNAMSFVVFEYMYVDFALLLKGPVECTCYSSGSLALSSMAASKKAARENVSMSLRKFNEFISIGISQRIRLHHAHEPRFYCDNNASGPVRMHTGVFLRVINYRSIKVLPMPRKYPLQSRVVFSIVKGLWRYKQ